ncbi:hypothetical protein A2U01_0111245, partial [Trifolium medium]|nr:hypothetical protein [Trifolium medium]
MARHASLLESAPGRLGRWRVALLHPACRAPSKFIRRAAQN